MKYKLCIIDRNLHNIAAIHDLYMRVLKLHLQLLVLPQRPPRRLMAPRPLQFHLHVGFGRIVASHNNTAVEAPIFLVNLV